jgi:hypothetical protein
MRVLTCLVAVGIAAATTGCIDMMAPGMGGTPYATSALANAFAPRPVAMSPFAASPYAANPYAVSPYAASPYAASPYAMSPYAASPYYSGYQQPQVINQTQYVPVPTAAPQPQRNFNRWARRHRDSDGDGIPNWKERRQRDSDGDGIPDWRERRQERRDQRRAAR